jgi:PAS domain S-box-containing protein
MEHTISWIRDENGIALGILGIARDVTETKNTENLLKESEEKYRSLFENSPNAVGLINTKGIVIQGNSNIEKVFGYKKEEFVGRNFRRFPLFSEENNAIVFNNLIKLIKGEIPESQELKLHRKDGSVIWVSMIASIVKLKKETLFQVITQDITKVKNAEKILEEQNKELQDVSNLKTEFLGRTSHELKTPLAIINGYAELIKLKKDKLNQDQLRMVEGIKRGCVRLEGIIHKLIECSKLETSKIELDAKEEDLSTLIELCVNEIQSLVKKGEININLDIANPILTKFNKDQIHEVISNLLSNAIKYSPHNSIINIKSELNGTSIIISIEDSGIGFTEDEKITIFNKFGKIARESNGFDVFSEGSGLGLYISKGIVELHDGKMWFESEGRNKGSTFYFSLPII